MQDDQLARMRARLAAEDQFVDDRGGQRWLATYVLPFYLKWMGVGAGGVEAQALLPDVRDRARELSIPDISAMVQMQWRVQVMGAWYAIARATRPLPVLCTKLSSGATERSRRPSLPQPS